MFHPIRSAETVLNLIKESKRVTTCDADALGCLASALAHYCFTVGIPAERAGELLANTVTLYECAKSGRMPVTTTRVEG